MTDAHWTPGISVPAAQWDIAAMQRDPAQRPCD